MGVFYGNYVVWCPHKRVKEFACDRVLNKLISDNAPYFVSHVTERFLRKSGVAYRLHFVSDVMCTGGNDTGKGRVGGAKPGHTHPEEVECLLEDEKK